MTVVAKYQGTTVKAMQALRKEAKADGTKVKVVKTGGPPSRSQARSLKTLTPAA